MSEIAGWIAPIATMIAAMMTASNLGARVTGWGFVVFTLGSLAWIAVAIGSGQSNLLLANIFLTLVNLVGIWRWLGRRATYDEGARAAAQDSEAKPVPRLFQLGGMEGWPVRDRAGEAVGQVVDAMAECETGRISYLVVREGGATTLSDRLHAVAWGRLSIGDNEVVLPMGEEDFQALPVLEADAWPARAPA